MSNSEEDSSGCEDPQPCQQMMEVIVSVMNIKYWSDCDIARSHTPRPHSQKQQDEADVSANVSEETNTRTQLSRKSKKGCGMCWKASSFRPNQAQLDQEEETCLEQRGLDPTRLHTAVY